MTLLVHAGIAAADMICCKALGPSAIGGDSHSEATGLLTRVKQPDGKELAKRLRQLLAVKTKAHGLVTTAERKAAQRAAEKLVKAAREL